MSPVVSGPEADERDALRVVAAAIRGVDGTVYSLPPPARHHNVCALMHEKGVDPMLEGNTQGFLLSDGRFCRRTPAKHVAERAGQLLPRATNLRELYSEDVW